MNKHTLEKHTDCKDEYCILCVGGLASCIICGGAECELPKECPGTKMTSEQKDQICAGHIDYIHGKWISYVR